MARKGILGTKLGMTQVFDENNRIVPVTVVKAGPNVVTRIRTPETDGYSAVQLAYGEISPRKVNKPVTGQYAAAGVNPRRHLAEFRLDNPDAAAEYEVGQELTAEIFAHGTPTIDPNVSGTPWLPLSVRRITTAFGEVEVAVKVCDATSYVPSVMLLELMLSGRPRTRLSGAAAIAFCTDVLSDNPAAANRAAASKPVCNCDLANCTWPTSVAKETKPKTTGTVTSAHTKVLPRMPIRRADDCFMT